MIKTLVTLITLALCISNAFYAQAQLTQAQFDELRRSLGLMTLALAVDEKCDLLDSVSAEAARLKVSGLKKTVSKAGLTGLDDYIKEWKDSVKNQSCLTDISSNQGVKLAKIEADALAGFYLLPWHRLYEIYGPTPNMQFKCDTIGPSHKMLKKAVDSQMHLIEKLKKRSDYKIILTQADKTANEIKVVCNKSGNFYSLQSHPNFKIIKTATNTRLTAGSGPNIGFLKVKDSAPQIIAYRGSYLPKGQIYTKLPWAVFIAGHEQGSSFFKDRSTVQVGFLRNKRFYANLRPPSFATFTVDIFEEISIEATISKQKWILRDRNTDHQAQTDTPSTSAQYALSKSLSKEIMDAVLAGNDLHLTVVRNESGKLRRVEVATIKATDVQKAITYAYAPKIVFD